VDFAGHIIHIIIKGADGVERGPRLDRQRQLRKLAQPTELGECDAFVSHSWRDDGADKWRVTSSWADAFQTSMGRSPSLWLEYAKAPRASEQRTSCSLTHNPATIHFA